MEDDDFVDLERGWVAPDGALPLVSDAWLPEDEWLQYADSGVVTLEAVRDVSGLLLLGEAGAGKSRCLRREHDAVAAAKSAGDAVQFVDLGQAMDARDLQGRVFEHGTFVAWRQGAGRLHLFLDALDEAKVQIRRVVSLLQEGFDGCDMNRLVLRVTCRTADRPVDLERWLARAFVSGKFQTLELAPLRMSEAKALTNARGVDPDKFMAEVEGASVMPLAARPLSLTMLLQVFAAEGGFPDTLTALYEQALLLMAGEHESERRSLRRLTDTAAFAVAARIAAATVLTGHDTIGEVDGAISLRDLSGGTEVDRLVAADSEVAVDERAVREVLGTSLFTARPGGVGWAHRTFGEYLAAYWLAGDRLTDQQVADLAVVDDGSDSRIAPPLRNVVGWLLGLRPSVQMELGADDALVLMYADPGSVAPQVRRDLLPSLLDSLDDQQVERRALRWMWRRIGYDGIEDDLRAVLTDPNRDEQTRQAAVDAVAELRLSGLMLTLVNLAEDPAQSVELRTSALYSLREFGDAVPLERIRPLALMPQAGDDEDEIKGAALHLCWPAAMTAEELFATLTPPKNEALLGAYTSFLRGACVEHLTDPDDLLIGVRWILPLPRGWNDTRDLNVVADIIVVRAWPLAARFPLIADALADLVELVAPDFRPVLSSANTLREEAPDSGLNDPAANVAIVEVLVHRVVEGALSQKVFRRAVLRGLGSSVDMDLVIGRWAAASSVALRDAWKEAITPMCRGEQADALYEVKKTHPELYDLVSWRYEPIKIDSPEAEALRQRHARDEAELVDVHRVPAAGPEDFNRQVIQYLSAFADGDNDAFWKLLRPLLVEDDGYIGNEQGNDDIVAMPGWQRMRDETRSDLVDAAEAYIRRGDPDPRRWLGKDVFFRPAHAGRCALRLLFNQRRVAFDALSVAAWRTWAPVIIAQRRYSAADDREPFRQAALACVADKAPDIARETVSTELPHRLYRGDIDAARERLGALWDSALDNQLFAQLDRSDLKVHEIVSVVEALLVKRRVDAEAWASARVTAHALVDDEVARELALGLAGALASHAPRRAWRLLRLISDQDEEATRILLTQLDDRSGANWEESLDLPELGELFRLLEHLYPASSAPARRGFEVTSEMRASFWRGRILERLVAAGTPEGVAVIAELESAYDDNGWIRRMRHRAQEEVRRARWCPPSPAAVVRMGSEDSRRLVADARALRRLVVEALHDIAGGMRGARSLAPALWNTKPHRLPKDENEISDILAEWLRSRIGGDKAIINREVQVNARTPRSADRTDLLVQATSRSTAPLSVVVEVKGSWNQQVMGAMDQQLAIRYLKPDLTDQGVYLVFWFSPYGWDDYDNVSERKRRARGTRVSAEVLAELLEGQAEEVSAARNVTIDALVVDASVEWPASSTTAGFGA